MLDSAVRDAVEDWLSDPAIDEKDKTEIRDLQEAGTAAESELTDRFYRDLAFGTGGMRGIIGAGRNRMNIYTVGAAAQGLASYISRQGDTSHRAGIAIACDCRRMSDVFADRIARVMASNGIRAYLFDSPRPTPELSFAIRHLGCAAGVVITASHNPPEYNGLKAYGADGGQVVPPEDGHIIEAVRGVGGFANVRIMASGEARAEGLITTIGRDMDEAFLNEVQDSCMNPEVCCEQGKQFKIVYTALHGTGGALIPEALRRRGFDHVIDVPEQAAPDGEFPTVESPNPEEAAALDRGIALAKREGADLVIGTDPDADRVGIAVRRRDGEFTLVSGNRIGALLTYYICEQLKRAGRFPNNGVVLSTIVSSDFMKEIARSYGAKVVETLTGFKWIGEKLHQYDREGAPGAPSRAFLFGAEESYGYLPAAFTRDKDAVTSTAFIAETAAFAAARGEGLYEMMEGLFRAFGYYEEGAANIVMKGKAGAEGIRVMMESFRKKAPRAIGGIEVAACADFLKGEDRDISTGEVLQRFDLPAADVLRFTLCDGTKVFARPSGTEPKIKFYVLTREPGDDLARAEERAGATIRTIIDDLMRRGEGEE